MIRYLIRRLLAFLPVLWAAETAVFVALRLTPGSPTDVLFAEANLSPAQAAAAQAQLGLDRPLLDQYLAFLSQLARGQLGTSLFSGRAVSATLVEATAPTVQLAASAMILALMLGLVVGIAAALRPGTPIEAVAGAVTAVSQALPVAWTGLLSLWLAAAVLRVNAQPVVALLLPALALGFATAGPIASATRASLGAVRRERHVLASRARGVAGWTLLGHTLRVALVPVVHLAALQSAFLFGGTVVTETVFARAGLGRLLIDSLLRQDYPVVQGLALAVAALYLLFSLLADLVSAALDPRLRAQWY